MFIHRDSCFVRIAGVTVKPVAAWVTQCAGNNLGGAFRPGERDQAPRPDRDTKFTSSFDAVVAADGTSVFTALVRARRANAVCARVIGTSWRECLDRVLILGRHHLEASANTEYVEHSNAHRRRRSRSQRPPADSDGTSTTIGDVDASGLGRACRLGRDIT